MLERLQTALAVLRSVEWAGRDDWGHPMCPSCERYKSHDSAPAGHAPDCALDAVLRAPPASAIPDGDEVRKGRERVNKDAMTLRIEFRRRLRTLEYAIEEREGRTSTSWSIQQAMRHETDKERVHPARGKLDEFVSDLIDQVAALRSGLVATPPGEVKTDKAEDYLFTYYRTEGQTLNENPRGVRLVHLPSGTAATVDNLPTTAENKAEALRILTARLQKKI